MVHENATSCGGGKLPTVVVQVVERFDVIDQLPRLARSHDRGGEAKRMERHVIFAHKLEILHIIRALVGAPPAFPCGVRFTVGIGPFGGCGDVFDGRIEPDVEHFAFHAGPWMLAALHRHPPVQITGDAPVLQTVAVIQPFLGDGCGQDRPVGFAVDPCLQLIAQRTLAQVKMLGFTHFKIG